MKFPNWRSSLKTSRLKLVNFARKWSKDQHLLHHPEVYAIAVGNQGILHAIVDLQSRRRLRGVIIVGGLVTSPEIASL